MILVVVVDLVGMGGVVVRSKWRSFGRCRRKRVGVIRLVGSLRHCYRWKTGILDFVAVVAAVAAVAAVAVAAAAVVADVASHHGIDSDPEGNCWVASWCRSWFPPFIIRGVRYSLLF